MELMTFITEHFIHAGPILLFAIFGVCIVAERCYVLYYRYPIKNIEKFFEKISALVMAAKIQEAIALCDKH